MIMNIELGKGLDKLHFGMSREAFKAFMGEPDEVEELANEDEVDDRSEVWHYDEMEISASFDEQEDWRLTSMAVSSPDFTFEGVDLIGLSQQEVMAQTELMDLGDALIEDVSENGQTSHQMVFLPEVSLNLWFDNGLLSEIQWGPYWSEEEEILIWPGEDL